MKLKMTDLDKCSESLHLYDHMSDLCIRVESDGRKPTRIRLSSTLFGFWRTFSRRAFGVDTIYHAGDRFQGTVEVLEDPTLPPDEMIAEGVAS